MKLTTVGELKAHLDLFKDDTKVVLWVQKDAASSDFSEDEGFVFLPAEPISLCNYDVDGTNCDVLKEDEIFHKEGHACVLAISSCFPGELTYREP